MLQVRRARERGHADHGWLNTYHTFSFADYHDPDWMGFRSLRVLNDDRVAGGTGFGMHPHRDMEILTYVLSGALQHRDSMGTGSIVRAGELQYMSAGTGILHSEFNPDPAEPVHLYQIWIVPDRRGLPPSYAQKAFAASEKHGRWRLVASPDGGDESLKIHQDARMYLAELPEGGSVEHVLAKDRHAWLQVLRGRVTFAGHTLDAGDGVAVRDEAALQLKAEQEAEVMLFDLA